MPTHKLWIEHTERAAWQSVQALREKLAEAERQAERMAPPVEGWRELFALLDAARESHALAGATYADLIAAALERLTRAEAERRALEARLLGEPLRPVPEPEPLPRRPHRTGGLVANEDEELSSERPSRSERQFFGKYASATESSARNGRDPIPSSSSATSKGVSPTCPRSIRPRSWILPPTSPRSRSTCGQLRDLDDD